MCDNIKRYIIQNADNIILGLFVIFIICTIYSSCIIDGFWSPVHKPSGRWSPVNKPRGKWSPVYGGRKEGYTRRPTTKSLYKKAGFGVYDEPYLASGDNPSSAYTTPYSGVGGYGQNFGPSGVPLV